jgi:hypothetical protein
MSKGFTEKEAKKLIGKSFETRAPFSGVPLRTKGLVTAALNSEDHWNVMIEWVLPGKPFKSWYGKHELVSYMNVVQPPAAG